MTGLNPDIDVILEIATIITDANLNILEQGPVHVIHQPEQAIEQMIPKVYDLHMYSGLVQAVRSSRTTLFQAQSDTLAFIKKYAPEKHTAYLAGNSVWQDRAFLRKYMSAITDHLHYRLLDVTSFKVALNAWYPHQKSGGYKKTDKHRALDDIKESIGELAFYKRHFLK